MRIGGYEPFEDQPASLHDDVLGRLRDFVVEGHLPSGARIPERELCARFAVSRTPLREALKVLAAEGLVELLPNRGARVRAFTEAGIRHLFEVIAGLDFVAGRLACVRISDEDIAAVERLHLDMARGALVPVPGGVLIRDASGALLGAVGISGDTSDNDEACAVAGIAAAGLKADAG